MLFCDGRCAFCFVSVGVCCDVVLLFFWHVVLNVCTLVCVMQLGLYFSMILLCVCVRVLFRYDVLCFFSARGGVVVLFEFLCV